LIAAQASRLQAARGPFNQTVPNQSIPALCQI